MERRHCHGRGLLVVADRDPDRVIKVWIPGPPRGKGRARTSTITGKDGQVRMATGKNGKPRPVLIHHTDRKTRDYEAHVRRLAVQAMDGRPPLQGPVNLALVFVMPIPRSWPQWKRDMALRREIAPTTKPDADNMQKAVKDALNGVAWLDDAQVVVCSIAKIYQREKFEDVGVLAVINRAPMLPSQITKKPESGR